MSNIPAAPARPPTSIPAPAVGAAAKPELELVAPLVAVAALAALPAALVAALAALPTALVAASIPELMAPPTSEGMASPAVAMTEVAASKAELAWLMRDC